MVWAAAFLFTVLFTYLSWRRYASFEMGRFDLGNMSQAVWTTAHGHILSVTDAAGNQVSRLAAHADPILTLLAPLYWVWANPKLLLLFQAAAVASGALPVYWIARQELSGRANLPRCLPQVLAFTYLLYPPLQYATLYDFHPVTLAPPLLLFAIWALRQRRYLLLAIFTVLALATKEEVGLLVVALGLYAAIVWRDRRAGLALMLAGTGWFMVATQVVIPHFNQGQPSALMGRYQQLGGSIGGILETAVTDPGKLLEVAFSGDKPGNLAAELGALLFLPLAAPAALLIAAPEFAINLLSSRAEQGSYRFHYLAPIVPFLIWATVLGIRRLAPYLGRVARALPVLLIVASLVAGWLMGPLPWWSKLPYGSTYRASNFSPDAHDRLTEEALKLVPTRSTVSTSNQIGSHLSQRMRILLFPQVAGAGYIVLDEQNPSFGEQWHSSDQEATLAALRKDPRYRLIYSKDGILIFKARRNIKASQTARSRLRAVSGQMKPAPKLPISM